MSAPPLSQLITRSQLAKLLTLSHATLWRYEQLGGFPKPFKLGPNRVAYSQLDIDNWLESKRMNNRE
jgi:predicted DNA-binding transcriptional regulator AlpA